MLGGNWLMAMACREHGSMELLLEILTDAATPVVRFLPEQDPRIAPR
ncbi:hypothetical protein ABZ235_08300 [Streptomyces canus]